MTEVFSIAMDLEPIPQARPRFRMITPKAGKPFITGYKPSKSKTAMFERGMMILMLQEWGNGREPLDCPLSLVVEFRLARPKSRSKARWPDRKPDLTNLLKSVEESLDKANVVKNDSRIVEIRAAKVWTNTKPGLTVALLRV